jgi:hypothetical protein
MFLIKSIEKGEIHILWPVISFYLSLNVFYIIKQKSICYVIPYLVNRSTDFD